MHSCEVLADPRTLAAQLSGGKLLIRFVTAQIVSRFSNNCGSKSAGSLCTSVIYRRPSFFHLSIFDKWSRRLWQIVDFHLAAAAVGRGNVIMRDVTAASRINANRCVDEWRPTWAASRKTFRDVHIARNRRRHSCMFSLREEITISITSMTMLTQTTLTGANRW